MKPHFILSLHITGRWSHLKSTLECILQYTTFPKLLLIVMFLIWFIVSPRELLYVQKCFGSSWNHALATIWSFLRTISPSRSFLTSKFRFFMKILIPCDLHWTMTLSCAQQNFSVSSSVFCLSLHIQFNYKNTIRLVDSIAEYISS